MANLTPEEKQRIYEEEKERLLAQERAKEELESQKKPKSFSLDKSGKQTKPGTALLALALFAGLGYFGWTLMSSPGQMMETTLTSTAKDFTIQVNGTRGTQFTGSYGDLSGQKSVDGTIPASYQINANGGMVTAVFQKQSEGGELKVTILSGGSEIRSDSTTAAYGMVSITAGN